MALRHLQLLRNTNTSLGRDAAKSAALTEAANLKDGEVIVARYLKDPEGQVSAENTAVALGFKVGNVTVFHDPAGDQEDFEALRKAVGAAKGSETITLQGAHYPSSSTTVVTALTAIDEQLYSATTAATNAHSVLGTTTAETTFDADGKYVSADTVSSVTLAVEALDAAIVDNDEADADLRAAVGVAKNVSALTFSNTAYLDSATTVVTALTTLDENLEELSGKVESNKVTGDSTIQVVSSAATGTTLGVNLDDETLESSIATAATVDGNILSATTDGLLAFADLNYAAATNTLEFINTNGKKSIKLTGVELLDSSTYDSTTEELILNFLTASGGTDEVRIPMSGLITEYEFTNSDETGATVASSSQHNVSLAIDRHVSGATQVYAELSIYDCGTY